MLSLGVAALGLLLFAINPGSARAEWNHTEFCSGAVIGGIHSGPESVCVAPGFAPHLEAIYGVGVQHSICVTSVIHSAANKSCSTGPGKEVYDPKPAGEVGRAEITAQEGVEGSTTVHGTYWWLPEESGGGGGGGGETPPSPPEKTSYWGGWASGYTLQLADVNGDGKADIVGRYGNDVQVALSNGSSFVPQGTWTSWSAGYTLQIADVNGDGKADIVGRYGNDVQVALSNGSSFVGQGTWTSWSAGYSLELADVNGDKKADIVGRNGGDIQVAFSTGAAFNPVGTWLFWSPAYSSEFADVTGDGLADAIGRYGNEVVVFRSS